MTPWMQNGRPIKNSSGVPLLCSKCPCEFSATPLISVYGLFVLAGDESAFDLNSWRDKGCYDKATGLLNPSPSSGAYCSSGTLMRYYVHSLDFTPNRVRSYGDPFNHPCFPATWWTYHTCMSETDLTPLVIPFVEISWANAAHSGAQMEKYGAIVAPSAGGSYTNGVIPNIKNCPVNGQTYSLPDYEGYYFKLTYSGRDHLVHTGEEEEDKSYLSCIDFGDGIPANSVTQSVHLEIWQEAA